VRLALGACTCVSTNEASLISRTQSLPRLNNSAELGYEGRSMKIVIAVHHFPPRYTGGAEWYAHRAARELGRRGHGVRVLCVEHIDRGTGGVSWEDDRYDGIAVRRLSFARGAAPDVFRWDYDNPWVGDHVRALLESERPDIFHLVSGYLMSVRPLCEAQALRIPTVVTLTDFWFLCPRITMLRSDGRLSTLPIAAATCARCLGEEQRRYRLLGRIAPALMDAVWHRRPAAVRRIDERAALLCETLARTTAIISPSHFVRDIYVGAGLPAGRIVVSRHGLDLPDAPPTRRPRSAAGPLRVGYLGQIAWHKGLHVLLEAFHRKRGVPMTAAIYGDAAAFPAYTRRLRRQAAGDERITFHSPYRGRPALRRILGEIDVVVVPSVWYENSPTVILEAFAHDVPVIVSDLGGMTELVRHGTSGLLFQHGDAADLARQLQRLIDEPGLVSALRAGIPPVRSAQAEIDDLLEIYGAAVAEQPLRLSHAAGGRAAS